MSLDRAGGLIGMTLEATIDLTGNPLPVPPRLADALDDDAVARRAFARLSYEQQRWLVLAVGTGDAAPALAVVP
jgi:hypothetical protein